MGVRAVRRDTVALSMESLTYCGVNRTRSGVKNEKGHDSWASINL